MSVESSLPQENTSVTLIAKSVTTQILHEEHHSDQRNTTPNVNSEMESLISLKNKITENDLILIEADKGKAVVILEKTEYKEKIEEYIKDNKLTVLQKSPVPQFDKKVRELVSNSTLFSSDFEKRLHIEMNPHPPLLYGLPKIHKTPLKIRPVVSYIGTPVYKIAQKASKIFKSTTGFKAERSISNTLELVNKIKNIHVPSGAKLISFDVVKLFNRIPPYDVMQIAENLILKSTIENTKKLELINMIELCLDHNYLQYNNKIYSDSNGIPIGSPLSPLMAEIFLAHIEDKIFAHPASSKILYWYRYVDDVLALYLGTDRQLDAFKQFINSLHPTIEFELEKSLNNTINFLDLTVTIKDNKHLFQIYRKPTHTDTVIHNQSCRPNSHKMAAFHSMIHRLKTIPLTPDAYDKEHKTIKTIAVNNGYKEKTIDKLLARKERDILSKQLIPDASQNSPTEPKQKVFIPYYGNVSEKVGRELRKLDYQVIFRSSNTLSKHISKPKDKIPNLKRSGVYKLKCGSQNCDKNYTGQTGRAFDVRINEHSREIRNLNNNYNEFTDHVITSGHSFNPNKDFELLHFLGKGRMLNVWENLEILKSFQINPDSCTNDQGKSFTSPIMNFLKAQ